MVNEIRHVGLVVRDVDRVLAFYRDSLGFVVQKDQLEKGPFVEKILGLPGLEVRTIKMKALSGALLELLWFQAYASPGIERPIYGGGFSHMALTVSDVDGLYRQLKARGIFFINDPEVSADGKAKVAFCRDPEGNFLELVQELT
ncbi:MAG: VOC family protein [Candidatus Omnitrophota bacterium]